MSSTGNQRNPLLIVLSLVAFFVPGSPRLSFSGIPFLSPFEVSALVLLLTVFFWRETRTTVLKQLNRPNLRSAVKLGLVAVVFLKVLLFARFPLQDGFEACYQSMYDRVGVCEKSYNNPFYRNDDINALGDVTRVDSSLRFGSTSNDPNSLAGLSQSNWNLPFTNDYPRFSTLWLDRLPFEAQYAGVINAQNDGFIPFEFVGEIDIELGARKYRFESYGAKKKLLLPVEKGSQIMRIHFEFKDSNDIDIPSIQPKPNGPYASLFVGRAVGSARELHQQLVIKGWVANTTPDNGMRKIALLDDNGKTILTNNTYFRPDVDQVLEMSVNQNTGFVLQTPISNDQQANKKYFLEASFFDGSSKRIAEIDWVGFSPLTSKPIIEFAPDDSLIYSLDFAEVEIAQQSPSLSAKRSIQPSMGWRFLLLATDGIQIVSLLLLFATLCVKARKQIYRGTTRAIVACSLIAVTRLIGIDLQVNQVPLELLIAVGIFAFSFRRETQGRVLATVLTAVFILVGPALDLLQRFYGVAADRWWGQLIFRSRDSDWLVYQGYARQIFTNQSLHGGEDIFYFMPGMRYLVYLQHVLFGENDVFISLASSVAMIAIVITVLFVAVNEIPKPYSHIVFAAFMMLLIQFGHPLMLELSMSTAAEVPAWILFMCATVLAIRQAASDRQRIAAAIMLGLVANFRPNYSFAAIWMFALLLVVTFLSEKSLASRTLAIGRSTTAFVITASLSLLHNLFYGGSGKPFTNISDPGQKDFEPRELLRFFTNTEIRELVVNKLLIALRWNNGNVLTVEMFAAIGIQVIWLFCIIIVIHRRQNLWVCLFSLITPLALLLSYMPFRFTDTPQRHFLMVSVTYVVSAMSAVMLSNTSFKNPRTLDLSSKT